MYFKLNDRKAFIIIFFAFLFMIMVFRLAQITIIQGEEYSKKAVNIRLKPQKEIAQRGVISDRNDIVLAGNGTALYLEYLYSSNKYSKEKFEKNVISIFKLLKENGEETIELPIVIRNGEFFYKSDIKKFKWLERQGFKANTSAREVFDLVCKREAISSKLSDFDKQQILFLKGIYLPILTKNMVFKFDKEKHEFLKSYNYKDDLNARGVFRKLRKRYKISEHITDQDAYYVIALRYELKKKFYSKYEPIVICNNLKEKTAILIEEQIVDFPNFNIEVRPYRYYPKKNLASHIIGYMGHISTENELKEFTEDKGYKPNDLIGKTGIEAAFENQLHGINGLTWIEADAKGEKIRNFDDAYNEDFKDVAPVPGKPVKLTIDAELQSKLRSYIKKLLDSLQAGSAYKSKFGSIKFDRAYKFARTGAAIMFNVKNGEILAMASYPDFDLNLFTGGINYEDWKSLQPDNKNDPLGPKPLYNIATMTPVQPGSTFKMATGFAALLEGLNPYMKVDAKGFIETEEGRKFGCWIWNLKRKMHGPVDLIEALKVSCNYYFYSIGSGYNFANQRPLGIKMNSKKIIEAARKFGFDEKSGIEIAEYIAGVPDPDRMKKYNVYALKRALETIAEDYFSERILSNKLLMDEKIAEILELAVDNPKISRGELYHVLKDTFEMKDRNKINEITDIIKYSHLKKMSSIYSDVYNLAIGQGGHAYTPAQMARYVSAIANGGYLQKLTLVKAIGGVPPIRQPFKFIDPENKTKYLRKGMRSAGIAVQESSGVKNFPYGLAAKTGTAQKEGRLSLANDEDYIRKHLSMITKHSLAAVEQKAEQILYERSSEIAELNNKIKTEKDPTTLEELQSKLNRYDFNIFLDRGNAMRTAIKELSNDKITDADIDKYKKSYDNFTWFVSYAPFDDPQVGVVVLIPQGGKGGYGLGVVVDIIDDYMRKYSK